MVQITPHLEIQLKESGRVSVSLDCALSSSHPAQYSCIGNGFSAL